MAVQRRFQSFIISFRWIINIELGIGSISDAVRQGIRNLMLDYSTNSDRIESPSNILDQSIIIDFIAIIMVSIKGHRCKGQKRVVPPDKLVERREESMGWIGVYFSNVLWDRLFFSYF